jgi:hypothetical protein
MPIALSPDAEPITVLTFVLELPRPLPVPANTSMVTLDGPTLGWEHWDPQARAGLLGTSDEMFTAETTPGTRVVFRQAEAWTVPSLYAADTAFADWVEPLLTEDELEHRGEILRLANEAGMPIRLGVVALTRFVPRSEHPPGHEITEKWLLALFRVALRDFNEFLDYLGFVARDLTLSALSDRDLPALLPVLIESSHASEQGTRLGMTTAVRLHDRFPVVQPEEYSPDLAATAVAIQTSYRHGDQPFGDFFRFAHSAMALFAASETSRAVTELATSIEVLVAVLLKQCPGRLGWPADQITRTENALASPKLRNLIEHHVARVLGEPITLVDGSTGPWATWWVTGYQGRNDAVHDGRRLTESEVDAAFRAAAEVIAYVKARLLAQPELVELGELLEIDIVPPQVEPEPLGITFPWEQDTG